MSSTHKPTTENKDGDNKKTCGQAVNDKFSAVGHFFQDGFKKLKDKLDCSKKQQPKNDDTKPAPKNDDTKAAQTFRRF